MLDRLVEEHFLTGPELERLASAVQYRIEDLEEVDGTPYKSNVIHIARIRLRRKNDDKPHRPVDVGTQATRLRHMAGFLEFIANYVGATPPGTMRRELEAERALALKASREHIPEVSKRATLNARAVSVWRSKNGS